MRRYISQVLSGFSDWLIAEAVDMVKRLCRLGSLCIVGDEAPTSARRWKQSGVLRTLLRHQLILASYRMGIPPARLALWR